MNFMIVNLTFSYKYTKKYKSIYTKKYILYLGLLTVGPDMGLLTIELENCGEKKSEELVCLMEILPIPQGAIV